MIARIIQGQGRMDFHRLLKALGSRRAMIATYDAKRLAAMGPAARADVESIRFVPPTLGGGGFGRFLVRFKRRRRA